MWYQPLDHKELGALVPRWKKGIWLGIVPTTSETIVGTPDGVFKTRSIRRKPDSDKWNLEEIQAIRGVPWKTTDFEDSDKLRIGLPDVGEPGENSDKQRGPDVEPRKFRIVGKDLENMVIHLTVKVAMPTAMERAANSTIRSAETGL